MKLWDISGDGSFWKVQLDVRDLGGHLDFTGRARAGTLSKRVGEATVGVAAVGALLLEFQVKFGWFVASTFLPVSMLLKLPMSPPRLSVPFRAAVVRAVWSSKMPLAGTPATLNLLDGPVGVDPAFHIVCARFRMMRWYSWLIVVRRTQNLPDVGLISRGAQGHGPVHLLRISAAEVGFAWDGEERGWVRVSLRPLRMMTGPIQHFYSSIFDAWRCGVFAKLSERKGSLGAEFVDFKGSLQLLTSSHLRERNKMLSRAILCGELWNGFLLGKAKKEDVQCRFCGRKDGDGHLFWECTFSPLSLLPAACKGATEVCQSYGR